MRRECFRLGNCALIASFALLLGGAAQAQESGAPDSSPTGFEPQFIETEALRGEDFLLYDWPALTTLVRWSGPVAEAVARDDGTLSAELVEEFRNRVDELSAAETPPFLAARSDSVRAILGRVVARLESADLMLADSLPLTVANPTGEERPNVSDRERTYATGPTAVTVPAGVDVGEADSLPGASIDGSGGTPTYVDLVAESLVELDGLVHLVRKVGEPATRDP